ncbi:hypothetical protein [Chelativorans salis]|uniref:Uncharacterized protein n=1 Tax=Chelativorans salis TaxID=2978478 RepID=A0ABT2LML8_9HYPH|nr:hypothetical protein [Chelativorans sp. EGI FJ00035]MCT7375556.1 hypothetical protein [Chelativorans sp. EGI FJ00035]
MDRTTLKVHAGAADFRPLTALNLHGVFPYPAAIHELSAQSIIGAMVKTFCFSIACGTLHPDHPG